jgi:hypothetical protein
MRIEESFEGGEHSLRRRGVAGHAQRRQRGMSDVLAGARCLLPPGIPEAPVTLAVGAKRRQRHIVSVGFEDATHKHFRRPEWVALSR